MTTSLWRFLFDEGSPRPIALVRILFCTGLLCSQLAMWNDATVFFSDQGVVSNQTLSQEQPDPRWSVLHFVGDPAAVRVLHVVFVLAILCVLVGLFTGPAAVILFLLAVSFRFRNPLVMNSGDQLVTIVAFWLMFARSGAVWSIDAWRRGETTWDRAWVWRTLQLQLCLIYLASGLHKLVDPDWRSGEAMFYVAALVYDWHQPLTGLMDHPAMYRSLSFATIGFELSFPILIWTRLRPAFRVVAILFHLGIGWFLGLPYFSAGMIALGFVFVSAQELDWLERPFRYSPSTVR